MDDELAENGKRAYIVAQTPRSTQDTEPTLILSWLADDGSRAIRPIPVGLGAGEAPT